jgi:uncharacterized membrane protein
VALFNFFKPKRLISHSDEEQIVQAIRTAETNTSGEVRVYIESKCRFVDPVDRAIEVFYGLKMEKTKERNAVLIYIALKDKQLAIYGDEGIHAHVGSDYWITSVKKMLEHFNKENIVAGLCSTILQIGETLKIEFPYKTTDKNELPDNIVFGS